MSKEITDTGRLDWLMGSDSECCTPPPLHQEHKLIWWVKCRIGCFNYKETPCFDDPRDAIDYAIKNKLEKKSNNEDN